MKSPISLKSNIDRRLKKGVGSFVSMESIISFKAKDIEKWLNNANRKAMQKLGNQMMHTVRKEIEAAPQGEYAKPGKSFHSHSNIKKSIQYGIDAADPGVVVIGPTFAQDLFALHELGGTEQIINPRRKPLTVGGVGPLELGPKALKGGKRGFTRRRKGGNGHAGQRYVNAPWYSRGNKNVNVPIRFGKLETAAQASRARRIADLAYGPERYAARYDPRPVLKNALEKNEAKIRDYIKKAYELE